MFVTTASLLFNPTYGLFVVKPAEVEGLERTVDLFPEEFHTSQVALTDYPVEAGAVGTDNAYLMPAELTMQGFVSDIDPLGSVGLVGIATDPQARAKEAWRRLREVQEKREPLKVTTLLGEYENMMIISIRPVVNQGTGLALIFDIAFRQIIIAQTEVIALSPEKLADPNNASTVDAGEKQSPTRDASLLTRLTESLGF